MIFQFQHWYLFPILFFPLIFKYIKKGSIVVPSIKGYKKDNIVKIYLGDFFLFLSYILAVIAIMRPQNVENIKNSVEGINISMVLDLSESMLQKDIAPSRIDAAKKVLAKFIDNRSNDKMSLVIFGVNAFPKVPATLDYKVLKDKLNEIEIGDINGLGTNIGEGMAFSLSMLKSSNGNKVMIICTDGMDTSGTNLPLEVAKLSNEMGIKIYSIGIGSYSRDIFGRKVDSIDEKLLTKISKETGGKYFRALSSSNLSKIFDEINNLEKSKIESDKLEIEELFKWFLIPAAILLLLSLFFNEVLWTRVP